jgi:peroxiredoxin
MAFTLQIGDKAPDFSLCGTDCLSHSLSDFNGSPTLVVFFTCNHCPYVIASDPYTIKTYEKFNPLGVDFLAINSNSPNTVAQDSFDNMVARMEKYHLPWLYLCDASQEIAKAYGALKTPHFFVFNNERKLIYTGRALDNPREPKKSTTNNLDLALTQHLENKPIQTPVTNPIGCNIKWESKPPHWMPPEACDLV